MSNLDDVNINGDSGVSGASISYSGQQKLNKTTRDKSRYLLSIGKRPRKNVKKRFADEMKPLRAIGEEEELINDEGIHSSARDQYRAPKAALSILLFVVSIGSYQILVDYWNAKELATTNVGASALLVGLSNETGLGQDLIQPYEIESIADTPITIVNGTLDIPKVLDMNLANAFHEPYDPSIHKLYLWHIPRSGSTTIKRIAANCLGLTLASEAGKTEVGLRGPESTLKIVEGADGMHFANVDMSFPEGIAHAHALHVGEDYRIDLVSSAYLYHTAGMFDPNHKGYMFAMMRHPIERAVSLFHNMRRYPQYAQVIGPVETVEMYAKSSLVENNWMTRFLSDKLGGQLGPEHEALAKEILRKKCIIGLLSDKTESVRRLESFFNAKAERSQRREDCTEKLLYWDWPGKNRHDNLQEGSEAWQRLYDQNRFDIRLYEYAKQLFVAQAVLF